MNVLKVMTLVIFGFSNRFLSLLAEVPNFLDVAISNN